MDINDLRGLSTAFLLVSFLCRVIWAYSRTRKSLLDEAAQLAFAESDERKGQDQH